MEMRFDVNYTRKSTLRYKGNIKMSGIQDIADRMISYIQTKGARPLGESIVVMHDIEMKSNTIDIEVLMPINKEIKPDAIFSYLPSFSLGKCAMIRFKGETYKIGNAYVRLQKFLIKMGIPPQIPMYNVVDIERTDIFGNIHLRDMEIDAYVKLPEGTPDRWWWGI